ncbi:unnamed protein product [Paramecium sonneborni]|uniref:Transmembrane protein n=1 Tax=Paramecium sonneborni TaxID=65129 RepID=A0A8S1QVC6_9CILI|nr:unnamed protein product [Paramecium sonneborni]
MTEFLRASFISSSSGTERQTHQNKIDSGLFRKKLKKNSNQINNSQLQKFRSFQNCSIQDSSDENQQQKVKSSIIESDTDQNQTYQKQSPIPTLQIDIQKNGKSKQKIQTQQRSKSRSKSPIHKIQQSTQLLTLQFDLKYRTIKLPVFLDDTSFTLTHKLLQELSVSTTAAIISKTSDIIQQTIEMYMTRLYDWINYNRLGKIDSALWKAQAYKNTSFLQDLEDEMKVDLLSQYQLIDQSQTIGKIKLYQFGQYIGDIAVYKNQDPQECIRNFFYSTGLHYDEQKFNRLVSEVIQIQLLSDECIDEKYTKDEIVTNVKVSHDKIVKVNAKRVQLESRQNYDQIKCQSQINTLISYQSERLDIKKLLYLIVCTILNIINISIYLQILIFFFNQQFFFFFQVQIHQLQIHSLSELPRLKNKKINFFEVLQTNSFLFQRTFLL